MKKLIFILPLLINTLLINAQFSIPQDVSKSLRPYLISVTDLNNDLQQDLIVAQEGNLIWMENQAGIYTNHIIIQDSFSSASRSIIAIETGDFDNNGFMDIVYSDKDFFSTIENFTILYNQNGISFTSTVIDQIDHTNIKTADLDGDGDIDIMANANYKNCKYINTGIGNFVKTEFVYGSQYMPGVQQITDLDGDQYLDLVVRERNTSTGGYKGAIVYLDVAINNVGYQVGNIGDFSNMVVTDLNNDNKKDIVLTLGNNVCCYLNIDSITWAPIDTLYNVTTGSIENTGIGVEDFRNDLVKEIVYFNNYKLHQLIFNGSDYEDFIIDTTLNYSDLSLNYIDMNDDGFIDIVGVGGSVIKSYNKNHISVLESVPNHGFNRNIIYDSDADAPKNVLSVDMDNDGDKDIAVTLMDKQIYYENIGNNIFSSTQNLLFKGYYNSVYTEDFNNDNMPDFLVCHTYYDSAGVFYYENIGNNTFTKTNIALPDSGVAYSTYIVDYDVDGDNDVCLVSGYNFYIIPNLGGGTFGSKFLIFSKTAFYTSINFADFNGNGFPDLIFGYWLASDRNFAYVPNNGGIFGTDTLITDALYSNSGDFKINAIEDYDNDGDLDLFASDYSKVVWIKNELGYPLDIVKNLTNIRVKNALDIDQDGDLDYIYKSPSINNYTLAYNENGIYSDIQLFDQDPFFNEAYSTGYVYFGDFGNNLKDMIYYGSTYGSAGSVDEVIFFNNKSDQIKKASGYMFYDQNQNKIMDYDELGIPMFNTTISPQSIYSFSNTEGFYSYLLDSGQYQLGFINKALWNLTTDSTIFNLNFGTNLFYDSLNFGFYPDTILTIINPDLTGAFPNCNDIINYWVSIQNQGTTFPSGTIHLQLDASIIFVSTEMNPDSIIGQNLYWHYDSLFFFSSEMIALQVQMPTFTNMGDTLTSFLTVHELDSNNVIYSNTDTLDQVLLCAYDPNDKTVNPKGFDSEGYISNNQNLEYLIRFQNTGNDTAITVTIKDSLDINLEWASMELIASSHDDLIVSMEQNGVTVFNFKNIMLPDSATDFLGSQGFVKFRIQLKSGLLANTSIYNTSNIYFDNNPAVITNTVLNTIYDCSSTPINLASSLICLNDSLLGTTIQEDFSLYLWNIGLFYQSSSNNLLWLSDTVGTFPIKLTISNAICSKDSTISITVLPTIPIINTNLSICPGDSLLIYGNYQNTPGIYYDSLQTINGCDSILATILNVNPIFSSNQTLSICQGDSLLLGGVYQTTSGLYYDSLQTILGCDSILSTQLVFNPLPNVDIAQFLLDTICGNGGLVTLPIGTPSGGSYSGIGVSGGNFDPSTAGIGSHNVIYTFTDTNSCINSDTTIITVQLCTGVDNISNDFGILIYPNPNTGLFTIEKPSGLNKEVHVKLLDATSKLILDKVIPIGKQKIEMDITNYSKGIYYLQLIVEDELFVKQIIKG